MNRPSPALATVADLKKWKENNMSVKVDKAIEKMTKECQGDEGSTEEGTRKYD